MPNGGDKNWHRLRATVDGFFLRFQRWPTRIRLHPDILINLREHVFPTSFGQLESKLEFVPDQTSGIVAEDEQGGRFSYTDDSEKGSPHPDAEEWLGVRPDVRPDDW